MRYGDWKRFQDFIGYGISERSDEVDRRIESKGRCMIGEKVQRIG